MEEPSVSVTITSLRQVLPLLVTSIVYSILCPAPATPPSRAAFSTGGEYANGGISRCGGVRIAFGVQGSLRGNRSVQKSATPNHSRGRHLPKGTAIVGR